jgi:hypothetical protein
MAATEAIRSAEPVQLGGSSFGLVGLYIIPDIPPLLRYACLFSVARLAFEGREPQR